MSILLSPSAPSSTGPTTAQGSDLAARADRRTGVGCHSLSVVEPVALFPGPPAPSPADGPGDTPLQASRTGLRREGYKRRWHIYGPDGVALCNRRLKLVAAACRDPSRTLPQLRCRHEACAAHFTAAEKVAA